MVLFLLVATMMWFVGVAVEKGDEDEGTSTDTDNETCNLSPIFCPTVETKQLKICFGLKVLAL